MRQFPTITEPQTAVTTPRTLDCISGIYTTFNMRAREALLRYLDKAMISPGAFARSINYDRSNFHKLLKNPDTKPSLDLAVLIARATNGEVPVEEWTQLNSSVDPPEPPMARGL